jgi:hypothetical protein
MQSASTTCLHSEFNLWDLQFIYQATMKYCKLTFGFYDDCLWCHYQIGISTQALDVQHTQCVAANRNTVTWLSTPVFWVQNPSN